ncbi:MAG TPA: hypothetical protein VF088_04595 [Pyrinomonadaceae bacterium]
MYNCREILRLTKRLSETATPDEGYWSGYHARLREKLSHATAQRRNESTGASVAPLRRCVRILLLPIPVPLAVAVIIGLVFGLFAVRSIRQPPAPAPAFVQVPIEVPVVQEKIVARVVYRDRYLPSKRPRRDSQVDSAVARSQKPPTDDIPSLTGFKPTEDVKLTVIKGGFPDEK